jgi:hypothetical protein
MVVRFLALYTWKRTCFFMDDFRVKLELTPDESTPMDPQDSSRDMYCAWFSYSALW